MRVRIRRSIKKMFSYTPGEQPGDGFIKLNTNECPYPPSPSVRAVLKNIDVSKLRLYPDPLCFDLRKRIALLHGCNIDQIFVGNGLDEVLSLCVRVFVEDNGVVGYLDPSYSLYSVLADIRGLRKKPVKLGRSFEWGMPSDYQANVFFLTNPNAPTGLYYEKRIVSDFCKKFKGLVVIDEAYVDFAEDNCMDFVRKFDNVLVLRSLSKSYSLAGIRVGYAVGPAKLIYYFYKIKDSYNVNRISQMVASAAIDDQQYMLDNVKKVKKTRKRLFDSLAKMGWEVYPSQANFIWTKPDGIRAIDVYEYLRKNKILVRYFSGKRTSSFIRISIGTDEEINKLLLTLDKINKTGVNT